MSEKPWRHLVIEPSAQCELCDRGTGGHGPCPWGRVATDSRPDRDRDPVCMALALQGADAMAWRKAGNLPRLVWSQP